MFGSNIFDKVRILVSRVQGVFSYTTVSPDISLVKQKYADSLMAKDEPTKIIPVNNSVRPAELKNTGVKETGALRFSDDLVEMTMDDYLAPSLKLFPSLTKVQQELENKYFVDLLSLNNSNVINNLGRFKQDILSYVNYRAEARDYIVTRLTEKERNFRLGGRKFNDHECLAVADEIKEVLSYVSLAFSSGADTNYKFNSLESLARTA